MKNRSSGSGSSMRCGVAKAWPLSSGRWHYGNPRLSGFSLVGRFKFPSWMILTSGDCQRCRKKSLHSLRNSSRGKSIEILEGFLIAFPVARPKMLEIGRIQHEGRGGCRPSLESAARVNGTTNKPVHHTAICACGMSPPAMRRWGGESLDRTVWDEP